MRFGPTMTTVLTNLGSQLLAALVAAFSNGSKKKEPEEMGVSGRGLSIIKEHEALRLTAYLPTKNDVWTIGWGHTKGVKKGMTITKAQAESFLKEDIVWVESALSRLVNVNLTQSQYDALASLVFNIGEGQFKDSTLLRKLNQKDYKGASEQFGVWVKQTQADGTKKTLQGLVKRRAQERALFDEAQ